MRSGLGHEDTNDLLFLVIRNAVSRAYLTGLLRFVFSGCLDFYPWETWKQLSIYSLSLPLSLIHICVCVENTNIWGDRRQPASSHCLQAWLFQAYQRNPVRTVYSLGQPIWIARQIVDENFLGPSLYQILSFASEKCTMLSRRHSNRRWILAVIVVVHMHKLW